MRILLAEDDPIQLFSFQLALPRWGYEVIAVTDGEAALERLSAADAPRLALLDWMMPGLSGPDVCRRVRALKRPEPTYLLLLTANDRVEDVVAGLRSGANDYVTKPFVEEELRARLDVGRMVVELQTSLAARVRELEAALAQVKQLHGLLPICCYCKKVRDDKNYWQQVEAYVSRHTAAQFSHTICPDCYQKEVEPKLQRQHSAPASRPA